MKIDPDCVRDLMMLLEEKTGMIPDEPYSFYGINAYSIMQVQKIQEKYQYGEVVYTLIQLAESGYISMTISCDNELRTARLGNILYVTPKGHEFVASIADASSWKNKILPVLKGVGSISLTVIETVSKGAVSAVIEHLMGPDHTSTLL